MRKTVFFQPYNISDFVSQYHLSSAMKILYQAFILSLLPLLTISLIDVESKNALCADGVYEALDVSFEGSDPEDYWGMTCTNPLKLISMYASAKLYCTQREIAAGFQLLASYCEEYGMVSLIPMSDFDANLTDASIESYPFLDLVDLDPTVNLTTPVRLTRDFFELSRRTVVSSLLKHSFELLLSLYCYRRSGTVSYIRTLYTGKTLCLIPLACCTKAQ
jgi:hypothetical protein